MTSQRESWITIEDDNIVRHSENDSYAFMRRGAEETTEIIMSVEEARKKGVYKEIWQNYDE